VVCIAAGRSATTYNSIATIVQKFGCATTPIRIRRGAQTECASVVSPTPHVMERKENRHARKIDMRKHEAYPSTYYNAKDVIDGPILLTIDSVQFEPVGDGTSKKDKPVARFKEEDSKLLVVSATKWDAIALIAKSDDTEGWGGVKIVLEAGKATYQGKLVDSINVRGPKQKGPPKPVVVADDELNDEIPY
jgi:hypothetical protein